MCPFVLSRPQRLVKAAKRVKKRGRTATAETTTSLSSYQKKDDKLRAAVVTQLTARSFPVPEDPGLNPVISNFY